MSTDRLRIYHGGETIFQPEDVNQDTVEDDGDEFGEVLIIPPAFHPVPPVERDIEEGTPLPASTENPPDPTENEVIRRRDERAGRRRTTKLYRLDPPDKFQFPPRREIVQEPMERTDPIVPVTDTEMEDLPGTQHYPQDLPSTPQNPPLVEARSEEETEPPEPV